MKMNLRTLPQLLQGQSWGWR